MDSEGINNELEKYLGYRLSSHGMKAFDDLVSQCSDSLLIASLEATKQRIELNKLDTNASRHSYLCGVIRNKLNQANGMEGYFE